MTITAKLAGLLVLAAIPGTANAQAAVPESTAFGFGGYASVSDGIKDRAYAGLMVDKYLASGFGLHLDATSVWREEDAAFAAVGASFSLGKARPRLMIGSSTDNRGILPELYVSGQIRAQVGPSTLVTPAVAYRKYRNGTKEYLPALEVVHYFSIAGDRGGYYAAQGRISRSIVNTRSKDTMAYALGLSTVRKSGLILGIGGEVGKLAYSDLISTGLKSDYWAVRPSVSIPLRKGMSLNIRGDYTRNDFYKTVGGLVGLRFKLD